MKFNLFHSLVYYISMNRIFFCFNGFLDIFYKNIIIFIKNKVTIENKWKHTPVNQVGTVSLCCILTGNVSHTAKHTLTACCLLTSRTVTRFYGKNHTSDFCLFRFYIKLFRNRLIDIF